MAKEKSDQARETYWLNHIRQWKQSGLSQIQYCSRHKISKNTLGYWIKKRIGQTAPSNPGFVQVPVEIVPDAPLELVINKRYKILISGRLDTELLKDTIKALEQLS